MKFLNITLLGLSLLCCNAQAAGVNVASGDVNGDGRPAGAASSDKKVQGNTAQPAVAIPSFMKNARKAKTAEAEDSGPDVAGQHQAVPRPAGSGAQPLPGRIAPRPVDPQKEIIASPGPGGAPGDIRAPQQSAPAALLVPAVQKIREAAASSDPATAPAGKPGYDIKRHDKL